MRRGKPAWVSCTSGDAGRAVQRDGAFPRTQGHGDEDELEVQKADPGDVGKVEHFGHGLCVSWEGTHADRLVKLGVECRRCAVEDDDYVAREAGLTGCNLEARKAGDSRAEIHRNTALAA